MANIQRRGKNSFLLSVVVGYDAKGNKMRKTKTVKTSSAKEARRLFAEFEREILAGEYVDPSKLSFEEFVSEWKDRYGNHSENLSPSTYEVYCGYLDSRIIPAFGHMKIEDVTTMQIIAFFDNLSRADGSDDPLSPSTVAYIHRVMKNVFTRAVEWQTIAKNPMEGVKRPSQGNVVVENYYEEHEAMEVMEALKSEQEHWQLYFLGALFGGFRRGELTALEWKNVDFENGCLDIESNLSITEKGNPIIQKPKTESSNASVDMPDWYMKKMRKYRSKWLEEKMQTGDRWKGGDKEFIFHAGEGKPLHEDTPTQKWQRFIKKNNLKRIRLHDLRHTTAVLLLEQDVPLKEIQARLRHNKYQTTADIYAHVSKKKRKETASKFDKFDPFSERG